MRYSNRDSFILSAPGAMNLEPCSLESIMAGAVAGARGCVLPVDTSSDGITLVCDQGCYRVPMTGEILPVHENTFEVLRAAYPKIVSFGQALELVKSSGGRLGIELHHPQTAAQVRVSLKYSDYLENAYFCGLSLADAAALAARYPDLQVMADLTEPPENPAAFVRQIQDLRLFGLRAKIDVLTETLCTEALRCGLFLAAVDVDEAGALHEMMVRGVNFLETHRPDHASCLPVVPVAPEPEVQPELEPVVQPADTVPDSLASDKPQPLPKTDIPAGSTTASDIFDELGLSDFPDLSDILRF